VKAGEKLTGLYAGNPKRATERPTMGMLLCAFKDIFLSSVQVDGHSYAISHRFLNSSAKFWGFSIFQ
jgi:hypothetical protein